MFHDFSFVLPTNTQTKLLLQDFNTTKHSLMSPSSCDLCIWFVPRSHHLLNNTKMYKVIFLYPEFPWILIYPMVCWYTWRWEKVYSTNKSHGGILIYETCALKIKPSDLRNIHSSNCLHSYCVILHKLEEYHFTAKKQINVREHRRGKQNGQSRETGNKTKTNKTKT